MQEQFLAPDSDLPPAEVHGLPPSASMIAPSAPATQPVVNQPIRAERARGGSFLMWTMFVLFTLTVFQFLAPHLAEQIQYSLTRGKQRAEYDTAGAALSDLSLDQLSLASQMISKRVGPSVVHINTSNNDQSEDPDGLDALTRPHYLLRGQGSGIIVDEQGYIVTNQHVIAGADEIDVRISDGRVVKAEIAGMDNLTDIAILKVDADNLIAAEWGDSDQLDVGALVWAMGSPFGLQRSITFGILSAKNRAGMAGKPHQDFLQTDAAVNPGNSGGPLINAKGQIVGINTAIVGEAYQGISFSIPSSVARNVYEQLRDGHPVSRGWLGVVLDEVTQEQARKNGLPNLQGALITQVVDANTASPAFTAGIRPGDIVVQWNGKPIGSPAALSRAVAETKIGTSAEVVVFRSGERIEMQVAVGERPRRFN